MNNDQIVEAIDEYFVDFNFRVIGENTIDVVSAPRPNRAKKMELVSVRYICARMTGKQDSEDLEITLQVKNETQFTILIPRDYLTPARDPRDDATTDLEHLIAENLVFQVDETIGYHTVRELDGARLDSFWA